MSDASLPEPWLRGTHTEVEAVARQVLHSLQQVGEDIDRWCASLTDVEMHAQPYGLPSVAFHLRHMARSLDRLLTYAEGRALDASQLAALATEAEPAANADSVLAELRSALDASARRVRALPPAERDAVRLVGRSRLPSTAGGLLIHCAEHTQRHLGQAITTAKLVVAMPRGDLHTA